MNKSTSLFSVLLIATAALAGCASDTMTKDTQDLNAKIGAPPTKSRTLSGLGTPEARVALPDQAECLQYTLKVGEKTTMAFGFDKNGKLLALSSDTCASAIERNIFSRAAAAAAK